MLNFRNICFLSAAIAACISGVVSAEPSTKF